MESAATTYAAFWRSGGRTPIHGHKRPVVLVEAQHCCARSPSPASLQSRSPGTGGMNSLAIRERVRSCAGWIVAAALLSAPTGSSG